MFPYPAEHQAGGLPELADQLVERESELGTYEDGVDRGGVQEVGGLLPEELCYRLPTEY